MLACQLANAKYHMFTTAAAVKFHPSLNPQLWDHFSLNPMVRYKLLMIAKKFIEFVNIPNLHLQDIVLTGSSASYTYTQYSDIDLHLVVDMHNDPQLVQLFDAKRGLWNAQHTPTMYGFPVEVYVQDSKESHISQGVYSILDNHWIEPPVRERVHIDDMSVKNKYKCLVKEIRDKIKTGTLDDLVNIKDKIKNMRKTGLADHGLYGVENITFKLLRNSGWIKKLFNKIAKLEDRELSLESAGLELFEAVRRYGMITESTHDLTQLKSQAKRFVRFAADYLELDHLPRITFTTRSQVGHGTMPSFGQFDPSNNAILVSVHSRHVMDIFRTLAHELVHYRQNLDNVLHAKSGMTGSKHENEANSKAGIIMRLFAKAYPNFFNQPVKDGLHESTSTLLEKDLDDSFFKKINIKVIFYKSRRLKLSMFVNYPSDSANYQDGQPVKVGSFVYYLNYNSASNVSSIHDKFQNLGFGKILLLAAIKAAAHFELPYYSDRSLTVAQNQVYLSLENQGYIRATDKSYVYPKSSKWAITTTGEQYLDKFAININYSEAGPETV